MINVYDFDKTIYDGDSTVDFYFYCLKRKKSILLFLPIQIWGALLYLLGIKEKKFFKEKFFMFLKKVPNVEVWVKDFWKENDNKIKNWYLKQKKETDVIISASPEFLLKPLKKKLKIDKIIASKVDTKTGKFMSENCHDKEKVKRFTLESKKKINEFYSDSMSDKPMMQLSKKAFLVSKDERREIKMDKNDDTTKLKKYVKIDKLLLICTILFFVIPITLQLFFWYNRIVSIPLIILLFVATYFVIKQHKPLKEEDYKKIFNKKKLFWFILLIIGFNLLSGAGGIFAQNWDYNGRNAIFRDLINNSWPVRYNYTGMAYESGIFGNHAIFNYYFAFWLPGALVGKAFGFKIASIFMLLWQTLGVTMFFYYVLRFMRNVKYRYFWIFLAFGGLNCIGYFIMNSMNGLPINPFGTVHIDTSMGIFCMSSFVTQLFWVFNQSLPAWILVMLFLQDKNYKTCGYYFALLVPFGPFPMLGFLYLIFCYIIFGKNLNKFIDFKRIKELLTIPNIFACISILPMVFMYTLNESKKGFWFVTAYNNGNLKSTIISYLLFVLLEFFVYIIIINKKNYKQVIMCFIFFTIAPMFYIGGADLGNRSTIPLLIVMYLLVIKYLDIIKKSDKKNFIMQKILIVILLTASVTNWNEINRSFLNTYNDYKNGYSNFADSYITFKKFEGKECSIFITNFVAADDKNNKMLQFILRK